ncbi:D-gluconate kinase [Escherichia coli]|uniref:D-gluconate kinase n=1 Tax=Escherichia coli TaxID=562 RepID=A0A376MPM5_ECOLX|nr:D-gluconate kinase [Escherichia coli]
MQRRAGHFMPVALLKSQFEALERPQEDEQDIVRIDINHDIANVTEQCRRLCWRYDKTEYVRKRAAPQISAANDFQKSAFNTTR